jgi:hypothetical protein
MKKRSILLLLVLAAAFGLLIAPGVALADAWTDISDAQWQSLYGVTAARVDSVADGYPDHTFHPTSQVTRAQFTKMALNGLGVAQKTPTSPTFSDVLKSNIFYSYIEGAVSAGLVNGTGANKFSPNSAITRQNVAAILGRWLSETERDARGYLAGATGTHYASFDAWYAGEGAGQLASFTDSSSISSKMRPWVAYLSARGIAKGTDGRFNPGSNITRAQAAVLILRTLDAGATFEAAIPSVTSVNPNTGPASGGTVVTIGGTNFTSGATVKFGTAAATNVAFNSATQITATSPAGTANAKVQVSVTTSAGTSVNTAADDFTYGSPMPAITALSPSAGAAAGGELVTITGSNFTSAATVKFGTTAVPAADVTYTSATEIKAYAPAGIINTTVQVSVTTVDGTSADTSADNYAYGKPVVSSISPVTGPAAGGTTVTINGNGFTDDVTVKFGLVTVTSANLTVNSPTKITAKSPAGTAGNKVQVSVTNDEGTSPDTVNDNFTYAGTGPGISSLTPSAGDASGGDEVVIQGANFPINGNAHLAVYFGTVRVDSADITLESATQMTIKRAPAQAVGVTVVDVSIATDGGASLNTPADDYSYGKPVITAITPASGLPAGGYSMVVTGTGFTPDVKVYWDGDALAAAKFTVDDPTQITLTVPAGDDGDSVDVSVENDEDESNVVEFRYDQDQPYITSISPTAGNYLGGGSVTIKGINFPADKEDVTVKFGTKVVPVTDITSITSTQVVVKVAAPLSANADVTQVADVSVQSEDGTSANTPADDYSYGRARVKSIEPNAGYPEGGAVVTVVGEGFVDGVLVHFGTTQVPYSEITVVSPKLIRVIAPAGDDGDKVRVKVANAEGASIQTESVDNEYLYDSEYNAPVVTSVSPNTGIAAGGTAVTILGSNFTIGSEVRFGDNEATDVEYFSSTKLVATSPAGPEGKKVHVVVTVEDMTSDTEFDTDGFTYIADGDPTVTGLNGAPEAYGPKTGGNTLVITGTGFSSKPTVKIGSKTVDSGDVTVDSTTRLSVIVPSVDTVATYDVKVTNTQDDYIAKDSYTYFTITVEYFYGTSIGQAGTWLPFANEDWAPGAVTNIRLRVLDGAGDAIATTDLSHSFPLLTYYKSDSDKGTVDPIMDKTDMQGYIHWIGFGSSFSGKSYTVKVGFDADNSGTLTDVDYYRSVLWIWIS